MSTIIREPGLDKSAALLREGYRFISERCERYGTDIFQTRLMLQPTICLRGAAAAELFYDESRFQRQGAFPVRLQKTLIGQGGVQSLDGAEHRHRKWLFMHMMTEPALQELITITQQEWDRAAQDWTKLSEVQLFSGTMTLLCRAICRWVGVPLPDAEVEKRTRDFAAMIDGGGGLGPRYLHGRLGRLRAEQWIKGLIEEIRQRNCPPVSNPLEAIALHRELNGELLPPRIAAVEVLNLLRPTVAVARHIVFSAHALHENPQLRERIRVEPGFVDLFIQEVRRFYPFFPFAAARVKESFTWREHRFKRGTRVMLDIYGTNRDPASWQNPETFVPERFRNFTPSPYSFIPQGGAEPFGQHRCAGERITLALMKQAALLLCGPLEYTVLPQNLSIRLSRVPAIPESRFLIRDVRYDPVTEAPAPMAGCPFHQAS